MQGYFPTFTPQRPNANLYRFNFGKSFLEGAEMVSDMQLERAAEDRLRETAELDGLVKRTLLPLQVQQAQTNIDATLALRDQRLATAKFQTERERGNARDTSRAAMEQAILNQINGAPITTFSQAVQTQIGDAAAPEANLWGTPAAGNQPDDFLYSEPPVSPAFLEFNDADGGVGIGIPLTENQGSPFDSLPENRFAATNLPVGSNMADTPTMVGKTLQTATEGDVYTQWKGESGKPAAERAAPSDAPSSLSLQDDELPPGAKAWADLPDPRIKNFSKELPDTPVRPKSITPSVLWNTFKTRQALARNAATSYNATKDPAMFAQSALLARTVNNDYMELNNALESYGLDHDTAKAIQEKFNDSSALDEAVQVRKEGAIEFGVPAGASWDTVTQVIAQRRTLPKAVPQEDKSSEYAKNYAGLVKELVNIPDGPEKDKLVEMAKDESIKYNRSLDPETRQVKYSEKQDEVARLINPAAWNDSNLDFRGVPITKDTPKENQITQSQWFNNLGAAGEIPTVKGNLTDEGFDFGDDNWTESLKKWHSDRGLSLPEQILVGAKIKTEKGFQHLPVVITPNWDAPEKSGFSPLVEVAKKPEPKPKPEPAVSDTPRKGLFGWGPQIEKIPEGGTDYVNDSTNALEDFVKDFGKDVGKGAKKFTNNVLDPNFWKPDGTLDREIFRDSGGTTQGRYEFAVAKVKELDDKLKNEPGVDKKSVISERDYYANVLNRMIKLGAKP